mgnify:CR=1 FL=1
MNDKEECTHENVVEVGEQEDGYPGGDIYHCKVSKLWQDLESRVTAMTNGYCLNCRKWVEMILRRGKWICPECGGSRWL